MCGGTLLGPGDKSPCVKSDVEDVQWWLPVTVQNNSSCKDPDGVTSCKSSDMRQEQSPGMLLWNVDKTK